jgi:predicted transcriptional regulator
MAATDRGPMTDSPVAAPHVDLRRHVIRVCGDYLLTMARLATEAVEADLITATTFLTISRDNLRQVTAAAQVEIAYSSIDDIPPDHLRKPVSVYGLARELNLPYETARRYVGKLTRAGLCDRCADGLVIRAQVYERPSMKRLVDRNWVEARKFVDALAGCGVRAETGEAPAPDVRRQVVRLSVDFFLNSVGRLTHSLDLDLINALLYAAVVQANVRHIAADAKLTSEFSSLEAIPPDRLRHAVSVYALSRELRLPYETTRRYIGHLIERGLCERAKGGGLVVPASVHARPELVAGVDLNWRDTTAYLAALGELGVGPSV